MKATIQVKDRKEAEAIRNGLDDPVTRALVVTIGVLNELPDDRERVRVLNFVMDKFNVTTISKEQP